MASGAAPFPIKVDHLLSNEVTLTRDPETGEYKGSFQLNGLAELLFQGKAAVEGEVTAGGTRNRPGWSWSTRM